MSEVTNTVVDEKTKAAKIQAEVNDLLLKLKAATNTNDKKKIRRQLRARNYYISKVEKPAEVVVKAEPAKANPVAKPITKAEIKAIKVPADGAALKPKNKGKRAVVKA